MTAHSEKPKALFIQPPVYDFALFDLFLKPYGLLRLVRWFRESGWETKVINGLSYSRKEQRRYRNGTGKFPRVLREKPSALDNINRYYARYGKTSEALEEEIRNYLPDIILITSEMTYWYPGVAEAVHMARELHKGVPVVVGGIYATLLPDHCEKICAPDYTVRGDADEKLPSILRRENLPGLFGPVPPLPEPELSVLKDAGILALNRGCPFQCDYCASSSMIPGFSSGDPEIAFEGFRELCQLGIRNFAFYDDALLINKEKVLHPFLERVIDSRQDVSFYLPNAVHVSEIDIPTALLMKKAGFREIRLGYESSAAEFHHRHDKKYGIEDFPKKVNLLLDAGFSARDISVYVLAGLPRQPFGEVRDSLHYAGKLGVKLFVAEYSPVPGSRMWQKSVEESRYPLEEEPLLHNNTFFPMEWEGFTRSQLEGCKKIAMDYRGRKSSPVMPVK